jgi:hypothetical protein
LHHSEVVVSAVKGVRRTFILTLDKDRHHPKVEMPNQRHCVRFCELRAMHEDMRVTETTQLLVAELEVQQV